MKATQKDFGSMITRAVKEARVFFFCGPDEAGALDAATRVVSLLPDAGERVELSGADLRKDPVRLGDEARSNSLFGGPRHIWVRASGDEAFDAIQTLLSDDVAGCPVIVVATNATDKSRTAKLLAPRADGFTAMFYPPDLSSAVASIRTISNMAGLKLGNDVAERIARSAALDTRIARSEVEKIALYLDASAQTPRSVSLQDIDAIGVAIEDDGFTNLVNAVLSGKRESIGLELRRLHTQGMNPLGVLLALERRAAQLAGLAARLGQGGDVAAFVKLEANARRIFWKDQAVFIEQMRIWRGKRLERLVDRLISLHQSLLANSQSADLLLSEGLLAVARLAVGASSRRTFTTFGHN